MGTQVIQYGSLTAANSATPTHTPGTIYQDLATGVTYQYINFDNGAGNVAAVAGGVAYVKTLASYVVTMDISDSLTTKQNGCCGVFVNVLTDAYYGWMVIKGPYATVKTDAGDDIAIDDSCIAHATTDGVVDRTATGTAAVSRIVGTATAADVDADDTVAVWVTVGGM